MPPDRDAPSARPPAPRLSDFDEFVSQWGAATNGQIFEAMRRIADACFDGHVTVMKFTTNWRVEFGPQRCVGYPSPDEAYAAIQAMPVGDTLLHAFLAALVQARWPQRA